MMVNQWCHTYTVLLRALTVYVGLAQARPNSIMLELLVASTSIYSNMY